MKQNKGILRKKCRVFKWYSMWYVQYMLSFKQLILWNWSLKEGWGQSSCLSSHKAIFNRAGIVSSDLKCFS